MCGLAGYATLHDGSGYRTWLISASEKLAHRGPDDHGLWFAENNRVGLAHRRLSIVDLTTLGAQPMSSAGRDINIVFNGEIYNFQELREELSQFGYSFKSESDTEVLIAAYRQWNQGMLSRLNGMFAFAIYDSTRNRMFLARDRVGEKPLYYRIAGSTFSFASELGALAKNSNAHLSVDLSSLEHYLAYGYAPGLKTLLDKHFKLPPAHFMTLDLDTFKFETTRYWSAPDFAGNSGSEDELLEELQKLLGDSVSRQLVADVPVGVLLSGGLDSSLVTALAAQRTGTVRTFTVAMSDAPALDESAHAQLIADYFATEHTVLPSELANAALIESIGARVGEPIADSSIIPTYLVSQEVRKSCAVALGGDGGDELFGGYGHYQTNLELGKRRPWLADSLVTIGARSAEYLLPVGFPGRNTLMSSQIIQPSGLSNAANHFDYIARKQLLSQFPIEIRGAERLRASGFPNTADIIANSTRFDFENYLPEDILVKVDRASMMNSLEVRAPFLDYRLIEFAFSKVPSSMKVTDSNKKVLLKKLASRLLPKEFDQSRKQGFSIPLAEWLKKGPIREMFWSHLQAESSVFDQKYVNKLLRNQDLGFRNSERLFALLQFELWRKDLGISDLSLGQS